MSLRYEWSFDVSVIGTLAVKITDDGGTVEATISSGTYAHTSINSVVSGYAAFATMLKSTLDTASVGAGTYTVTWNGTTGYTINYSSGNFTLAFSTVTTAAQGVRMRQILGMSGDRSGASSYSSQVRPYFMVIPAIAGRSNMSDEFEPDGVMFEEEADDGVAYQTSKDTSAVYSDWTQAAETQTAPSTFSDIGTPPFTRLATAAVPWTYQDAWEHQRLGKHPFLVLDGSESAVHEIRAEGASFRPTRFSGADLPFWSIGFRTRLLGRL